MFPRLSALPRALPVVANRLVQRVGVLHSAPGFSFGAAGNVFVPRSFTTLSDTGVTGGATLDDSIRTHDMTVHAAKRSREALGHAVALIKDHGYDTTDIFSDQLHKAASVMEKLQSYADSPDFDSQKLFKMIDSARSIVAEIKAKVEDPDGHQVPESFKQELEDVIAGTAEVFSDVTKRICHEH